LGGREREKEKEEERSVILPTDFLSLFLLRPRQKGEGWGERGKKKASAEDRVSERKREEGV